jgi:hypothetical protein
MARWSLDLTDNMTPLWEVLLDPHQNPPSGFVPSAASTASWGHPQGDQLSRMSAVGRGRTDHAHGLAIARKDKV